MSKYRKWNYGMCTTRNKLAALARDIYRLYKTAQEEIFIEVSCDGTFSDFHPELKVLVISRFKILEPWEIVLDTNKVDTAIWLGWQNVCQVVAQWKAGDIEELPASTATKLEVEGFLAKVEVR